MISRKIKFFFIAAALNIAHLFSHETHKEIAIIKCSYQPSKYEKILMTQLRDKTTTIQDFRATANKIGDILVSKVVECLPTKSIEIETPLTKCNGETFAENIELVSVLRSGDVLLDIFMKHFPEAKVSKFLVQRDEETAKPHFIYKKPTSTLGTDASVIITEPMIATGGTLDMVIPMLIESGVKEKNIIIASICAAPEGLMVLNEKFPEIKVVFIVLDSHLNERKYIVPGIGDFGDRYYGTIKH